MFGFESLVKLVKDTSESLDVGMTGLLIPGKGIEHFENRWETQEPLLPGMSRFIRTQALQQVQDGRSIVINQAADQARYGLYSPFRAKLIITPLTGGTSHAIGLLVAINDGASRDFSNSDRNLLQVMASRIDKVLHVNFDPLTGLENTQSFEWAVGRALSGVRSGTCKAALMNVDLDRFSVINSAYGREAGDLLITQVADLLAEEAGTRDTVARIGADKFGLLLTDASQEDAALVAEKLRRKIARIELGPAEFQHMVSACIGVTSIDEKCHTVAETLTMVELANKAAKEKGVNRVQEYQETDLNLASRRGEHKWVGQIFDAISKDRFVLFVQLIQPIKEQAGLPHYEVLVRMRGEDGEILPPNKFIPAAEHYRLMPDLDWWVVKHALDQLSELRQITGELEGIFSINLSGQSLTDERLQYQLFLALDDIGDMASKIVFEVTESAAIANMVEALDFMRKARSFGCKFSLDDFGSGLSSFAYLQSLPVDYLKIDGSFVRDMARNEVSRSMVSAINHVGQVMGLTTIAEFVEDAAIVDSLQRIGVDYAQGYHYGRPRPLREVCDELVAQRRVVNG